MPELFLIRHGATPLNGSPGTVDRIRGWSDVPLSAKGREDADKLGKQLKNSGIQLIYFSTLQRAQKTAEAIAKTTGAQMQPVPALRPWNVGIFTGKDSNDAHPELHRYATQKPDEPIPQGESFNGFKNRVLDSLGAISAKAEQTPTAIVTHHRVERLIKAWQKAGEPEDRSIDMGIMFEKGEPTGHAEKVDIDPAKLANGGQQPMQPPAQQQPAPQQTAPRRPMMKASPQQLAAALQGGR